MVFENEDDAFFPNYNKTPTNAKVMPSIQVSALVQPASKLHQDSK